MQRQQLVTTVCHFLTANFHLSLTNKLLIFNTELNCKTSPSCFYNKHLIIISYYLLNSLQMQWPYAIIELEKYKHKFFKFIIQKLKPIPKGQTSYFFFFFTYMSNSISTKIYFKIKNP